MRAVLRMNLLGFSHILLSKCIALDNRWASATVGQRYKLHEHVGAGSYGDVCKATDLETLETVALKVREWLAEGLSWVSSRLREFLVFVEFDNASSSVSDSVKSLLKVLLSTCSPLVAGLAVLRLYMTLIYALLLLFCSTENPRCLLLPHAGQEGSS
jgi:hypothetical protein